MIFQYKYQSNTHPYEQRKQKENSKVNYIKNICFDTFSNTKYIFHEGKKKKTKIKLPMFLFECLSFFSEHSKKKITIDTIIIIEL